MLKHSRAELRNKIISAATLLEILLSGLVLIGLLLSMVPLLQWMPACCSTAMTSR